MLFSRRRSATSAGVLLVAFLLAGALPPAIGSAVPAVKCDGMEATITGSQGNDTLIGTTGSDVIAGLAGDDVIHGAGGNDRICGGLGKDQLFGDDGNDRLFGQAGRDRLNGGGGGDWAYAGPGNDVLVGGGGEDRLYGEAGDDYLSGGNGTDNGDGGADQDSCLTEAVLYCEPTLVATDFTPVTDSYDCDYESWDEGPVQLDGATYEDALFCGSDDVGDQGWQEYNLGRNYRRFRATIGQGDYSWDTQSVYRFRVFGDGALLTSVDVAYGTHAALVADVSGVLRMKIEVTKISGPGNADAIPVWAGAVVSANAMTRVQAPVRVSPYVRGRIGIDLQEVADSHDCDYETWEIGPAPIDGTVYSDSLQCSSDDVGDSGWAEYVLSRAYGSLETTIGQRDDSDSAADVYRFRFYADGSLVETQDVGFGQAVPIDLDMTGVLRLKLTVEKISGPNNVESWPVFGEPIVTP